MEEGKLGRVIRKISGTDKYVPVQIFEATVVSVDEGSRTCIVNSERDNSDGITVNLMASVDDGHFQVPTVGATVIVIYNEIVGAILAQHSGIDKHLLIAGNQSYQNDGTVQKFNDGSDGGLVKVINLTTQINRLEDKLNDLISKFNSHTHILVLAGCAAGSGGTGLADAPVNVETPIPNNTTRDIIENTSITHGKSL